MLGMSTVGTAIVLVVAIVAVTLLVASVVQAVRDTRIARHTGQAPKQRHERRDSTVQHP